MRNWNWALAVLILGNVVRADEPLRKFDVERLLNAPPEKQLEAALLYNPEIRQAEDKMRSAQGEWKQAKAAVLLRLQTLRTERDQARQAVAEADEKLEEENLSAEERKAVTEARAEAAELERARNLELTAALGVAPLMPADAPPSAFFVDPKHRGAPVADPRAKLPKELVARLDRDLAKPLNFAENFEMNLPAALVELQKKAGTSIVVQTKFQNDDGDGALGIDVKVPKSEGMTLGVVLLLIEDQADIDIYVREYGLLFGPRDFGPNGKPVRLRDFLKK